MTIADRWLLPDGIEEVLPFEATAIEQVRTTVLATFKQWGYQYVIPPAAEFLESLFTGAGHDLDLMTFKVTDQYSGRLMGLPADITQQVARMDAHSMPKASTGRYCYANQVLRSKPSSLLSNRCPLQLGAELFGSDRTEADIEVIDLMLSSLASLDMNDVTLDLGHVAIFRSLVAAWQLPKDEQKELRNILQRKSTPEFAQWLQQSNLNEQHQSQAQAYFGLSGGLSVLGQAKQSLAGISTEIDSAVEQLEQVSKAISQANPDVNIHIDLAELRGYDYHTGLVFAVFKQGVGKAIAKGGRYDETGKVFGRARPATGFSMDARFVAGLLAQDQMQTDLIFAPNAADVALAEQVQLLRSSGKSVVVALSEHDTAASLNCTDELVQDASGNWLLSSQITRA